MLGGVSDGEEDEETQSDRPFVFLHRSSWNSMQTHTQVDFCLF